MRGEQQRLWDRFRAQPVHLLCWAVFLGIFGWASARAFPEEFRDDPAFAVSDYIFFYMGADAIREGRDPYERWTYATKTDRAYSYPPLFATLIAPLPDLGLTESARVWFAINSVLALALFLGWWALVSRRFGLPRDALMSGATLMLASIVGIELVRRQIGSLQTDTLMLAGLLVMTAAMDRRDDAGRVPGFILWPALAGLGLAFSIHIKFMPLVFLLYLLVTRRLATLGWTIAWVLAIFLATAAVSGWNDNLHHYAMSLGGGGQLLGSVETEPGLPPRVHDMTWEDSVSIKSAVARLLADGSLDYSRGAAMAIGFAIALAMGGIGWAIYRWRGVPLFAAFWTRTARTDAAARRRLAVLEVTMGITAMLAFSPQTMKRHMFLMVPLLILVAAFTLAGRRGVRIWPTALALLLLLGGMTLPPGNEQFRHMVEAWKYVSGLSWCLLAAAFLTLWTGLDTHRAIQAGEPIADPPPPRSPWFGKKKAAG